MITLENISTGEVYNGDEIEYFIDDDTLIGEVYLDGDLIFQSLEVIDAEILNASLLSEFMFETLPQISLQGYNNYLSGTFSAVSIFSTAIWRSV